MHFSGKGVNVVVKEVIFRVIRSVIVMRLFLTSNV